jgi:hypothetical protein
MADLSYKSVYVSIWYMFIYIYILISKIIVGEYHQCVLRCTKMFGQRWGAVGSEVPRFKCWLFILMVSITSVAIKFGYPQFSKPSFMFSQKIKTWYPDPSINPMKSVEVRQNSLVTGDAGEKSVEDLPCSVQRTLRGHQHLGCGIPWTSGDFMNILHILGIIAP